MESTELSIEVSKETKVCELSRTTTENTNHKIPTTKQGDSENSKSSKSPFAAAGLKKPFKEGESQTRGNTRSDSPTASTGQKKVKSEATQSSSGDEKNT